MIWITENLMIQLLWGNLGFVLDCTLCSLLSLIHMYGFGTLKFSIITRFDTITYDF